VPFLEDVTVDLNYFFFVFHGAFQNIILVGGGAFLFKHAVKEAFPRHKIHEIKDPIYANVRGFQIAGMNYARSAFEKGVYADVSELKGEGGTP
jgi:hypothetical protein